MIQRATLLVLNEKNNKALKMIDSIDDRLDNFSLYRKSYFFIFKNKSLKVNIDKLQMEWVILKKELIKYQFNNESVKDRIIKLSENLWLFSDHAEFIAEHKVEKLRKRLWITFYVVILNIILILLLFWISKVLIRDKLEYYANYDSLTNILNKKIFYNYLNNFIKLSKRYKKPFCLLMFDVDYFKEINDTKGHQVGDEILKLIVQLIKNEIRETDIFARFGGDEFIILTPEINLKEGRVIAEKIRKSVKNQAFCDDVKTSLSIGLTEYKNEDTLHSIISRVDKALYKSKRKGRNKYSIL